MSKSKTITLETPAMYGDHHVLAIRQTLLEMPGVEEVYASSGFRAVEVTYNPDQIKGDAITNKLEEFGYLGEWSIPIEADSATYLESDRSQSFFRHTEVLEKEEQVISFSQNVEFVGKPLWNCPGFGVIKEEKEDK